MVGKLDTIPAKIIIEIPLPIPFTEIWSPSHMTRATVTLKNQLRQIKSSLSVRIRNGKYVDGDWSHEKETLVETLADLEPHEFIEKVVYENMLASVELDAWIVEKARNL